MESLILETEKLHKNNEKPPPRFVIYTITDKLCVSFFLCVVTIKKKLQCALEQIVGFHMTSLKLSILPRFYFHDALEQLKTNFHTNFLFWFCDRARLNF